MYRSACTALSVSGRLSPPPLRRHPPHRSTPCITSTIGASGISRPQTAQPSASGAKPAASISRHTKAVFTSRGSLPNVPRANRAFSSSGRISAAAMAS